MRRMEVPEVVLSTYFLPQLRIDPPPYQVVGGGFIGISMDPPLYGSEVPVSTNNNATVNQLLYEHVSKGRHSSHLAACTTETANALFPCRTSVDPERCLDGQRACSTAEHNGHAPWLELDFHETAQGGTYPHLLIFKLPPQEEYGRLLFHALNDDVQENRGWLIEIFDANHTKIDVPIHDWNIGANVAEYSEGLRVVQHALFEAITSDETYAEASRARFLRVSLIGELRQIWLANIELFIRDVPEKLV